jgi:DNA invertase Pin-like site-specific DNA recombinase
MSAHELISSGHLARKAIIYVRQSTPQQTLSNQESLRLQYALEQHAISLGWHPEDVVVIDADLGVSARSTAQRAGFQEVVTQVTLGQVGILLSYDVTRLARNCSDWYPLLDLCGYRDCLIGDRDGVYDPASANGRLLLGLKGQLSELELHTIRTRLTAGLLNKAARGELALRLPVGLVRDPCGRVIKEPHQEVQDRLSWIFASFQEWRSANKVLRYCTAHDLLLPRRDHFGDVTWRLPTRSAILAILKNPAYAGAFVYGRSRTSAGGPAGPRRQQRRLPMEQWKVCIKNVYPASSEWEAFERIQAMLQDNYAASERTGARGVPRAGKALLHGIIACGECGHKMGVLYKGGVRYRCTALRARYQGPVCQAIPGAPVDAAVVAAFFAAFAPIELDAYAQAVATHRAHEQQLAHARQQDLERLRYEAELARRQFTRVDPDNRLVAAELEGRWEAALRALKQAETAASEHAPQESPLRALPADLIACFQAVGQHLPRLWQDGTLDQTQKKALVRTLIELVIVLRCGRDRVQVRIVWKGGETAELSVPIPVPAWAQLAEAAVMEERIVAQSRQGIPDAVIAQELTTQGYRSPMRPQVLPSTVSRIRRAHRIFQKPQLAGPRRVAGALTVPQLATALERSPYWIYHRITNGTIAVAKDPHAKRFLFPDVPDTLLQFRHLRDGARRTLCFCDGQGGPTNDG